jgi:hypothetical protein
MGIGRRPVSERRRDSTSLERALERPAPDHHSLGVGLDGPPRFGPSARRAPFGVSRRARPETLALGARPMVEGTSGLTRRGSLRGDRRFSRTSGIASGMPPAFASTGPGGIGLRVHVRRALHSSGERGATRGAQPFGSRVPRQGTAGRKHPRWGRRLAKASPGRWPAKAAAGAPRERSERESARGSEHRATRRAFSDEGDRLSDGSSPLPSKRASGMRGPQAVLTDSSIAEKREQAGSRRLTGRPDGRPGESPRERSSPPLFGGEQPGQGRRVAFVSTRPIRREAVFSRGRGSRFRRRREAVFAAVLRHRGGEPSGGTEGARRNRAGPHGSGRAAVARRSEQRGRPRSSIERPAPLLPRQARSDTRRRETPCRPTQPAKLRCPTRDERSGVERRPGGATNGAPLPARCGLDGVGGAREQRANAKWSGRGRTISPSCTSPGSPHAHPR